MSKISEKTKEIIKKALANDLQIAESDLECTLLCFSDAEKKVHVIPCNDQQLPSDAAVNAMVDDLIEISYLRRHE